MPSESETFTLRLGFDAAVADAANEAAIGEWTAVCAQDGYTTAGDVCVTVIRDDPAHQALGQVVVEVTGQRTRDAG